MRLEPGSVDHGVIEVGGMATPSGVQLTGRGRSNNGRLEKMCFPSDHWVLAGNQLFAHTVDSAPVREPKHVGSVIATTANNILEVRFKLSHCQPNLKDLVRPVRTRTELQGHHQCAGPSPRVIVYGLQQ